MQADVSIEAWDDDSYQWKPFRTYQDCEVRSFGDGTIWAVAPLVFDLPDGEYSDGTQKIRRWYLEHPIAQMPLFPRFEGFAMVEVFEDDQDREFEGYRKQRWTIRERAPRG